MKPNRLLNAIGSRSIGLTRVSRVLICYSMALMSFLVNASPIHAQNAVISIQPDSTYQTITGWEAVAGAGEVEFPSQFASVKDSLFHLVVNDIGINRIRLEVKSGTENPVDYFTQFINGQITYGEWKQHWYEIINDNENPLATNWDNFQFSVLDFQVDSIVDPLKNLIEANGDHLYINLCYVDFGASAFEHSDNALEYAEFIAAIFQYLDSAYGWVPDGVEVILEPDNSSNWNGTAIGQAVAMAAQRLQSYGYSPDFIVPSTSQASAAPSYFDQIIQVPGALENISEISYHRYGNSSFNNLLQIVNRAEHYAKNTSMLEWWDAANNFETLHEDLKYGRNSAWHRGILAWPISDFLAPAALFLIDDISNPANPTLIMNEGTKFIRQYFKFIRAGAVRIKASTTSEDFDPLAFINPDGRYVVVVRIEGSGAFLVTGLPSGLYGIKYTTPQEYDVDLPDVTVNEGDSLSTGIPYEGVITIYQKTTSGENQSPIKLDTIPNVAYFEDSGPNIVVENLNNFFTDPDSGDFLIFESFSDNSNISTSTINDSLILYSSPNFFGSGNIAVNAVDNGGLTASDTFSVVIYPVNDPPSINNIPNVFFRIDSSFSMSLDVYVTDVDNNTDELNWTATVLSAQSLFSGSAGTFNSDFSTSNQQGIPIKSIIHPSDLIITIDSSSHKAVFTTSPNIIGLFVVEFKAEDPGGLSDTYTIKVIVTPFAAAFSLTSPTSGNKGQMKHELPLEYHLNQNYPNPFNPSTTIAFQLPMESDVKLEIYDLLGQKIQSLIDQRLEAGYYEVVWSGRNNIGDKVSSGIYIYRLSAGNFLKIKKMLFLE